MRKTKALFLAAGILCVGLWTFGQTTVKATGTAAILHHDAAQARDKALDNALRTAVEKVVGTMVDSESLVKNNDLISDKIYTQTTGYISGYKVLSEKKDEDVNIYSVTVEAKVKNGSLTNDLHSMGILMHRMKMPRVAVALRENRDDASASILQLLKNKGFNVVDTGGTASGSRFWGMDQNSQADLVKKYGAEVVILGSAKTSSGGAVGKHGMKSYQATVSLKALKTDTHEVMGTSDGAGKAVHISDVGYSQALRQAATVAGNRIVSLITRQWARESSSSRLVILEVRTANASRIDDLVKRLPEEARGVQNVIVRESSRGRATLNVYMQGDASDLARELTKIYKGTRVIQQSANKLTVSL